jgi:hypothetical protein
MPMGGVGQWFMGSGKWGVGKKSFTFADSGSIFLN